MPHLTAQFNTPSLPFQQQPNTDHPYSQIISLPSSHHLPNILRIHFPIQITSKMYTVISFLPRHSLCFPMKKIRNCNAYKQLETFYICIIKFQTQSDLLHPKMSHFNFQNYAKPEAYSLVPPSFLLALSNYPYQQLILQHNHLLQDLTTVKSQLATLRGELQALKDEHKTFLLTSGGYQQANGFKSKKIFKKDKICPIDGCNRKYSSRIAVNAHLRKFHGRRVQRE